MDRFLEYVCSFDPTFASRIEGASADEIARVEHAAGPLPPDYRRFLELMGRRDDEIAGVDVQTSAADIVAFYEEVSRGDDEVPEGCIAFAISGLSIEQLSFERQKPHRVFQVPGDDTTILWASSLRGFFYKQAFARSVEQQRAHAAVYVVEDKRPCLHLAEALLESIELQRLWFSDEVTLCYESDVESVAISQLEDQKLWARLSSDRSGARVSLLAGRLSAALGAPLSKIG